MPNEPKKKPKPLNVEMWASDITMAEVGGTHGLPIKIVDPTEAEQASVVVCVYAGQEDDRFKADNIYTNCADCAKPITHRPHAPKAPAKVCMPCAIIRMQNEAEESCDEN
jgi:hypothetical protein